MPEPGSLIFSNSSSLDYTLNSDEYSINLLFIGSSAKLNEKYFEMIVTSLKNWSKNNPGTKIKLWYDEEITSDDDIANIKKELIQAMGVQDLGSNIEFHPIQSMSVVKDNLPLFDQGIPIYWRIDFLKLIISLYELNLEGNKFTTFTDLDELGNSIRKKKFTSIKEGVPVDKSILFSQDILEKINKYGMLHNGENMFLQFMDELHTVQALTLIINFLLQQAANILKQDGFKSLDCDFVYKITKKFLPELIDMLKKGHMQHTVSVDGQNIEFNLNDLSTLLGKFTGARSMVNLQGECIDLVDIVDLICQQVTQEEHFKKVKRTDLNYPGHGGGAAPFNFTIPANFEPKLLIKPEESASSPRPSSNASSR